MADRIYIETQILGAAVDIMRAAFQVCPWCKNSTFHREGQFSKSIFEFEDFTDRKYMSDYIIPAVIKQEPERVLWVGIQVNPVPHRAPLPYQRLPLSAKGNAAPSNQCTCKVLQQLTQSKTTMLGSHFAALIFLGITCLMVDSHFFGSSHHLSACSHTLYEHCTSWRAQAFG